MLSLLLILVLAIPVMITLAPATPVSATADNVTITSPTTSVPATGSVGSSIPVSFTVGVSGSSAQIDILILLYRSGSPTGISNSYLTTATGESMAAPFTYSLIIPAGTDNGTYDLVVQARHPSGSGTYTSSTLQSSCIIINTGSAVTAPTLLTPTSGSCTNDNTPTFNWTSVSPATNSYNFQISTSSTFSTIAQSATIGPPGTTATYTATTLADGLYYWRVRTVDQYSNVSAWTTGWSICIDTGTPGAPSALLTPADASTVSGSYSPTYTWNASTGDSCTCASINYVVETYSDVSLAASTLVDNATVGVPSYTRNTVLSGGTYYWRVKAFNCGGVVTAYTSPFSYTMPATCTSYTIQLGPGWNLVSLPLVPTNNAIASIIPANVQTLMLATGGIYYLNYASGTAAPTWKWWTPERGATITTMDACKAYWIYVSGACTFTVTGTPCTASSSSAIPTPMSCPMTYSTGYTDGWNMVGFKSCTSMTANTYFANLTNGASNTYSSVYRWAGTWVPVAGTDYLTPGTGYYIRMNASGTVLPPCY